MEVKGIHIKIFDTILAIESLSPEETLALAYLRGRLALLREIVDGE